MSVTNLAIADVAQVYVGMARGCRCGCSGWWSNDPEHIAAVVQLLQRAPVVCIGPFSVEYVFAGTVFVAEFKDRDPEKVSEYLGLIRESAAAEAADANPEASASTIESFPRLAEIRQAFGTVDAFLAEFE